jgi:hypothetical protein
MVAGGRHVFFDWHTIYIVFRLVAGHDGTNWKIVAGEARKKGNAEEVTPTFLLI